MIAFTNGKERFVYRVAGVALDGDRVLLHRCESDDFWALPGGRAELMETAADTLRREMSEEIGVDVEVQRLLWVVENFFEDANLAYHELGLYFLMALPANCSLRIQESFCGQELYLDGTQQTIKLIFQWFPVDCLSSVPLFPSFLRRALRSLPQSTKHIVHRDVE